MKRFILLASLALFSPLGNFVKADFGEASFPENYFLDGPKSYHDGWCRFLNNECRIRFQGNAMWVEGVGGIYLDQFTNYRYDTDRPNQAFFGSGEHYNYITYTPFVDIYIDQSITIFVFECFVFVSVVSVSLLLLLKFQFTPIKLALFFTLQ